MKNNTIKRKVLSAVAIATAFLMGFSPVSAYAQAEDTGNDKCTCAIKCTAEDINNNCKVCGYDYTKCEGISLERGGDDEHYGPLTPEGNLTLVDDYGSLEAGGKQFITVVSKNGNYFYIIIDRDDEGEETVHFLNMVDESDLLALMDEDQVDEYIAVTQNKNVQPAPMEVVKEEKEVEEPIPVVEEKKSTSPVVALILLLMLGGGAGYIYYSKMKENKQEENEVDPDADYIETENYDDAFDIEADDEIEYLDEEDDIEDLDEIMNPNPEFDTE